MCANKNFKSLFTVFQHFLDVCEGDSEEKDVEMMFQSAKIIEDTCLELENIGEAECFETKLNQFLEIKRSKCVNLKFFKKASYHLLCQYMVNSKFSESEVIMAVHQFITNKSEREFQELAQQLANTNQIVEELRKSLNTSDNIGKYRAEHCREDLKKVLMHNKGDIEEIYSEVSKSVLNHHSMFKVFLDLLCLPSSCEVTNYIQEVVMMSLSDLLYDSNNTNLYSQLLELNEQDMHSIVTKWPHFIEPLLQTVRVSVERLRCNYSGNTYTWTTTGTDPCLSFDQIVTLMNRCGNVHGVNVKLLEFLHQIGEEGFRVLAEDIMHKCQIR